MPDNLIERAREYWTDHKDTWNRSITDIMVAFAQSLDQWTPVSEGLPDASKEEFYWVTVYADGSDVRNGWQSGYYVTCTIYGIASGEPFWGDEVHAGYTVVAWMPYHEPAPYQPQGEGK